MNKNPRSGIDPDKISEYMNRALAIDQELIYLLESSERYDEAKLLREQARCCFRALAEVQNEIEICQYLGGRVKPSAFNISDVAEDIFAVVRSKMRNSAITLESDIEPLIYASADADRFSACLMNLIINALQNVDREEGRVRLTLKAKLGYAAVSVIDNGYGMTQQQLSDSLDGEGSNGFDVLKRFCAAVGTSPVFETTENGGFSVTIKVPLAPPPDKIELRSKARPRLGTLSPFAVMLYKLDEAIVDI